MNVNNRTKKPSVGGVGELMDVQRFGPVDAAALVKRLQRPAHPVDVVLDTDAYNEIDDQYAIAYLLLHQVWRREFQNKNGANSKTTEYAANIQKADLEEALQARYLMCSVQFPAVALQL